MAPARALILSAGVMLAGGLACAEDARPVTEPTRDVEVVYSVASGGVPAQQRARWQVSTRRQRVDAPNGGDFMIADGGAGPVTIVSPASRRATQMKAGPNPLSGGKATFKKIGADTIAGLHCTDWDVTPAPELHLPPNQVCLTEDGVLLRARDGAAERARAVSVTYAPADPALFAVPAGYAMQKSGQ